MESMLEGVLPALQKTQGWGGAILAAETGCFDAVCGQTQKEGRQGDLNLWSEAEPELVGIASPPKGRSRARR